MSADHGLGLGLGDDDHPQYLNAARHASESHVTDHGSLTGLDGNDHVQYLFQSNYQNSLAEDWDTDMDTTPPSVGNHLEYIGVFETELDKSAYVNHAGSNNPTLTMPAGQYAGIRCDNAQEVRIDAGVSVQVNRMKFHQDFGHWVASLTLYHSADGVVWTQTNPVYTGLTDGESILDFTPTTARFWKIDKTGTENPTRDWDGQWWKFFMNIPLWAPRAPDHGGLGGLTDDDHVAYHTDARAATWHTALSGDHVTNGDTHDHAGGDGGQVDHGGLGGLGDDDHTQYHLSDGSRDHAGHFLPSTNNYDLGSATADERWRNLYLVTANTGGTSATEGRVTWDGENDYFSYRNIEHQWYFIANNVEVAVLEQTRPFDWDMSGSVTDPTLGLGGDQSSFYSIHGNICTIHLFWKFGTSGVNRGSGEYYFEMNLASIPEPLVGFATADDKAVGTWRIKGSGTATRYVGACVMNNGGVVAQVYMEQDGDSSRQGDSTPFVFDAEDIVSMVFSYPVEFEPV